MRVTAAEHLSALASVIDEQLNGLDIAQSPTTCFILLISQFSSAPTGTVDYISNAEYSDALSMLKQIVARMEGQPMTEGRA